MYTTSIAFTFFLSWATIFAAKEVKPKHSPLSAAPVDGHLSRSDSFVRNPSFGRNRGEIELNLEGKLNKQTHQSSSRNEEPLLYRFEQGYPPQSSLESYYSSNESDLSHLSTESSMQGSHESLLSLGSHHLPNESHQTDISSSPEEFARRNPTLSSLSDQSVSSSSSSSLSDQSSMSSASSFSSHGAYHPMAHITQSDISTESSLSRDSIASELERRRGHHQQTRGYPVSPDRINQHQHKHQHGSIARRKRIRIQPASLIKLEVNINAQHQHPPKPTEKQGKKEEQKNEFIVMVFWRSDHHLVERFDTKFVR